MCQAGGTVPGTDTVFTGGSIDAFCDQIVPGANEPGDVLAIFGATLIVWVVTEEWMQVPGLVSYPHTTPARFLIGGPSNAGALFVDWARHLLRGACPPRTGPGAAGSPAGQPRPRPGVAALSPGRAHPAQRPHPALEPLRPRYRLERRGARTRRVRGQWFRDRPDHRGIRRDGPTVSWPVAGDPGSRPGCRRWPTPRSCRWTRWPCPTARPSARPTWLAWPPDWRPRSTTRTAGPASAGGSSPIRTGPRPPGPAIDSSVTWGRGNENPAGS